MAGRQTPTVTLPPLGAHVSVAGGLCSAFPRAAELECTAMQVFVKNASQWRGKDLADDEADAFRAAHTASAVGPLVAHASYLINLASTDPLVLERSAAALADELVRCGRLGVHGLVLHPGAHLGMGEEAGLESFAAALERVLAAVPGVPTRVLLENTAGQGTCLGCRLEHLARIRSLVSAPHRVGVCLDTCHAFAAGYPLHEPAGREAFLAEVEELLGLDVLGCFHVNDSVKPFNSRRDRHAHIGDGEIGLDLFAWLLTEPRLAAIPMVLETEPGDDMEGHRRDLDTLRGLAGLPVPKRRRKKKPRTRRA
jgi:deoxyribonuclease-4